MGQVPTICLVFVVVRCIPFQENYKIVLVKNWILIMSGCDDYETSKYLGKLESVVQHLYWKDCISS